MWLFGFVWISGILGAALQHFMPPLPNAQLPMETIYEQIDSRPRTTGRRSADNLVEDTLPASGRRRIACQPKRQRAIYSPVPARKRADGGFWPADQPTG